MRKIELVGARRYSFKGEKFEQNVHYMIGEDRAALLCRLTTDQGRMVFREVGKEFRPVAPQRPRAPRADIPVVDTTTTAAEQYDKAIAESVGDIESEAKPVVAKKRRKSRKKKVSKKTANKVMEEPALVETQDEDDGVEV